MADGPKKISELPLASAIANADLFVVVTNTTTTPVTSRIRANTIVSNIAALVVSNLPLSNLAYNIIPATDNTYSLGNSSYQWKSLYVSNNTIYVANVPLTINSAGGLVINSVPIVTVNTITSLSANNTAYLGGTAASGYQTTAGLSANVATLKANTGDVTFSGANIENVSRVTSNNNLSIDSNTSVFVGAGYSVGNTFTISGFQANTNRSAIFSYTSNSVIFTESGVVADSETDTVYVAGDLSVGQVYYQDNRVHNIKLEDPRTNILDPIGRPLLNPNALDINSDGGTSRAVYSSTDPAFDGGAGETVFGLYEAALDGGISFNNRHSTSYIDGGRYK